MTEDIMADISLNKIVVAILKKIGPVNVTTLDLFNAGNTDTELVLTYDENEPPSFTISLKEKIEQQ
jgi:hypothetical protein